MSELKPEQLLELMKGEILNFRGVQWMLNGEAMPFTLQSLTRVANIALKAASTIPASEAGELPSLPEPFGTMGTYDDAGVTRFRDGFTADQMRDYARAALASTRTASDTRTAAGEAHPYHRDLEGLNEFIDSFCQGDSRLIACAEAAWYRCMDRNHALNAGHAAGEAECDAALRAAPAGQHAAAGEVLDEVRIVEIAEAWAMTSHAYQSTPLNHCVDFARAIVAELASRGAAQGRITCKESVTSNSAKNGTESPETRMDTGSRTDVNSAAEVDVEAEREFDAWFEGWRVSTWRPLPSDIAKGRADCPKHWNMNAKMHMRIAFFAARTQADAGKDKALLDFLDQWVAKNKSEGYNWFTFAFGPNETARTQIKAEMDLAATKPEKT